MGGHRKTAIQRLFSQMDDTLDPPVFVSGVPSRQLRSRRELLKVAHEIGLVPQEEWDALCTAMNETDDSFSFDCLEDVRVHPGRQGSKEDVRLHYCVELWRKAKGINRGRAVLACAFAHLRAMKKFFDEGQFDLILEDNVRADPRTCSERIWQVLEAVAKSNSDNGSENHEQSSSHLRYYGWLGSRPNLRWTMETFAPSRGDGVVFPFPVLEDFDELNDDAAEAEVATRDVHSTIGQTKAGGTAIWGAFAYAISKEGYDSILERLRLDVGALLWKSKRMRHYLVKPIDKIIPRSVTSKFGRDAIQVAVAPAFFRAPMLSSKIHRKWDAEFCKSTAYQLGITGLDWSDLWLTEDEEAAVQRYTTTGDWVVFAVDD